MRGQTFATLSMDCQKPEPLSIPKTTWSTMHNSLLESPSLNVRISDCSIWEILLILVYLILVSFHDQVSWY